MNSLVQLTIDAHGGLERWRRFEYVTAHLRTGGILWGLKHQQGVLDDVNVRVRFNLSREYLRAIAKLAFHYFLWTCPWTGGHESEFDGIREFVSNGDGDEHEFLQRHECLVDRAGSKMVLIPTATCLWPSLTTASCS